MKQAKQEIQQLLQDNYLVFKALGDKQRQEVLFHLYATPGISVGELTSKMTLSRPAVSHHLKILKSAGLLTETRQGVRRHYQPQIENSLQALRVLAERLNEIEQELIVKTSEREG